jgi:iron complex outermembrane receptor protein
MTSKKLAAGVALTTLASLCASGAIAQSTASQLSEVVVTTNRVQSTGGLAVQVQVAKNQAVITQQFIEKQTGSSNAAQLINLLPGVSYSTGDPTGVLSDDFRMHGFDGNHTSWTIDGTPVNDTGNYATFPGEYLVGELTERVTVNIGTTEVDSPSASAIGGTVNIVSKVPPRKMGFALTGSGGSYGYYRGYGEFDTGEVGPWGTRAYFAVNDTHSNKYQGGGSIDRKGADFRVYQPLRDKDFISVAGTFNKLRAYFYESSSLAQYAQFGNHLDYNTQWGVPTVRAGVADGIGGPATATAPGFLQGGDASQGFWAYHPNPVDFGDLRIQSRFDLSHNFTLTFDPYFFYTLANGGGNTSLKESDPRLAGNSGKAACTDLNGDGDCLDTVLVYSPNITQTHRFGLSTSLLWDLNEHNHFQLAYNLDYGNHRQTAIYSRIDQQTGMPDNVFGGGFGGTPIATQDGFKVRGRDRFSIAELNQISFNYIGRFLDDKLHISAGVRDPMLTRKLSQYCYTYNGTSAYCDTIDQGLVQAAYNAGVAAHNAAALTTLLGTTVSYNTVTQAPNFRLPFKQTLTYSKFLPNAGVSYNFTPEHQIYFTYAQGYSAPRTDNLYSSSPQGVKPEITDNYGAGYRYHSGMFTASVSPWYSVWSNHIVTAFDRTDPTISIDRNVGAVTLYGVDLEAGVKPVQNMLLYASASFMKTRLGSNYAVPTVAGSADALVDLPTKGKELVVSPDQTYVVRAEYKFFGALNVGVQAKYTGRRFTSDVNDQQIGAFTVADLDAEFTVPGTGGRTVLQLNVNNLFGANYLSRASSTVGNATRLTLTGPTGGIDTVAANTPFYYVGAPTTIYGAIKLKF